MILNISFKMVIGSSWGTFRSFDQSGTGKSLIPHVFLTSKKGRFAICSALC